MIEELKKEELLEVGSTVNHRRKSLCVRNGTLFLDTKE